MPDAIPMAMSLACDGGQVVVVGSPRGKAKDVNFYDDLHRRYIEVTGAHGNMLFEPAHTRLAGAWDINKARSWLLAAFAAERLSLAGLVTHRIGPEGLGDAYEGLLKKKDEYLGVVVRWRESGLSEPRARGSPALIVDLLRCLSEPERSEGGFPRHPRWRLGL